MSRDYTSLYPKYTAELAELREKGLSEELLYKIIQKHRGNSEYN